MDHFKIAKLLEGLAREHIDACRCAASGCLYCEALIDVATSVTADWVASLARELEGARRAAEDLPDWRPVQVGQLLDRIMDQLSRQVANG